MLSSIKQSEEFQELKAALEFSIEAVTQKNKITTKAIIASDLAAEYIAESKKFTDFALEADQKVDRSIYQVMLKTQKVIEMVEKIEK